ncbi:hypothetical protein KDI_48960 [Dictyobacter arantiisoli]|uniref:Uncharacterized protein n=1 Tax=Dictyobacter arantiisoli TaxID=2014874 RepID=A0A5A5TJ09_9CHLR|nr:hypothetical protein KDI_48960 [Dictyobacter arantiisoli]
MFQVTVIGVAVGVGCTVGVSVADTVGVAVDLTRSIFTNLDVIKLPWVAGVAVAFTCLVVLLTDWFPHAVISTETRANTTTEQII